MESLVCFLLGAGGMWWLMTQFGNTRVGVIQELSASVTEQIKKVSALVNENETTVKEVRARMEKMEEALKGRQ